MELVPGTCAERYLAFKNTQGSSITVEDIRAEEKRLGLDIVLIIPFDKEFSLMPAQMFADTVLKVFI